MDEKKMRVIKTAKDVFLKYGYVKATMNDLAKAAGISRPALYLIFPGKEDIFNSVILFIAGELSEKVKHEISIIGNPLDKLRKACDIWSVQMHELLNRSAEARELYQSSFPFTKESVQKYVEMYQNDIAEILSLLPARQLNGGVSAKELAYVFVAAVGAFKQNTQTTEELTAHIEMLIRIIINQEA